MTTRILIAALLGAPVLTGQLVAQAISIPSISVPKAAAKRAVALSNAQTNAEQNVDAASPLTPHAQPHVTSSATVSAAVDRSHGVSATNVALVSDSGAKTVSITQRGVKGELSLNREVYSYDQGSRRDPFVSLMQNGDLRPLLSDLRLVTVLYDPTGRNSIAVMHDVSSTAKDQYRVRVGQTLGRMRVAQIEPKEVVFTIEEVGFSRQQALALGDSTTARTQ